ncbi:MAG: ExbD/TolR family protein [Thermoguttaceae bacterium]
MPPKKTISLNMTSMIDVIFLLLIFFVCTANFNTVEESLPTNLSLPGSIEDTSIKSPEDEDFKPVWIQIIASEASPTQSTAPTLLNWRVQGRDCVSVVEVESVLTDISQIKHDLPVIIDPIGAVPFGDVVNIYDLCRKLGLTRIQLSVKT